MEVNITDERPELDLIITEDNQEFDLQISDDGHDVTVNIDDESDEVLIEISDEEPPTKITIEESHGLSAYQLYLATTTANPPLSLKDWLDSFGGGDTEYIDDQIEANLKYKVEILSTNGTAFRNDVIDTTLIAIVYKGNVDVTDTMSGTFRWTRKSDDPEADTMWNLQHANFNSNILNIDSEDVDNKAVFSCQVIIN